MKKRNKKSYFVENDMKVAYPVLRSHNRIAPMFTEFFDRITCCAIKRPITVDPCGRGCEFCRARPWVSSKPVDRREYAAGSITSGLLAGWPLKSVTGMTTLLAIAAMYAAQASAGPVCTVSLPQGQRSLFSSFFHLFSHVVMVF